MRASVELVLVVIASLLAVSAGADTWYVPSECPTIQAGIDSAAVGDTVLVACGTYYEHDIVVKSGVRLVSETGHADCVTIDAQQLGRVFYCSFVDSLASIVGFTVTGGLATGTHPDFCGGAMYGLLASPTIKNCTFVANQAVRGGAVYCDYASDFTFEDCKFVENQVEGHGGGLYLSAASPVLTDCTLEANQATGLDGNGGGMYCQSSSCPTLVRCTFDRNRVDFLAGGMYSGGNSLPTLTHCTFTANEAGIGAGLYCHSSSPTITECSFAANQALYAAGLGCELYSSPTVSSCTFEGNRAENGAGADCDDYSSPTFTGCTFVDNSFDGLYCYASSPTLTGCTFAENGGIALHLSNGSHATVENCIVAFGERPIRCWMNSAADLTCTNVYGNVSGNWGYDCISDQYGVNGNIGEDPLFCGGQSQVSPFTLHSGSPCAPEYNPDCGLIGAWGVDCGTTVAKKVSWGAIKVMFR